MNKSKVFYLEFLRALACFSVILLHSVSDVVSNPDVFGTNTWHIANIVNTFTRFAVPTFFMISGYLSLSAKKETGLWEYLKKKVGKILVPLFLAALFYYVIGDPGGQLSASDFLYRFITMNVKYHLWFLYALFALELLAPLLRILIGAAERKYIWYLFILSVLPTTVFPFINKMSGVWIFRYQPLFYGYLGYYLLGYLLGTAEIGKRARVMLYALGGAWYLAAVVGNWRLSVRNGLDLYFNGGYTIDHYFLAAAIFVFARYGVRSCGFLQKPVRLMGELSFYIYLLHVLVLTIVKTYIPSPHIVEILLLSVPVFLISAALAYALKKILTVFPGRRRVRAE